MRILIAILTACAVLLAPISVSAQETPPIPHVEKRKIEDAPALPTSCQQQELEHIIDLITWKGYAQILQERNNTCQIKLRARTATMTAALVVAESKPPEVRTDWGLVIGAGGIGVAVGAIITLLLTK